MIKLDPRPARGLTSREHAKILCGLLGGMAFNVEVKDLRSALRYVNDMTRNPQAAGQTVESGVPLWVYSTLSGFVSCMVGGFGKKAALEAIEWAIEKEEVWERMSMVVTKTRESLEGKAGDQLNRAVDELRQELG